MSVHEQKIGPAIIIEIQEHRAPAKILSMEPQSGGEGYVIKRAIPVIAIESGSIVGEVRAKNVQLAIAIEVGNSATHSCLRAPVFVERRSGDHSHIGEGAVMIVVVQDAGSAVASDINVGPAVIVVVEGRDTERVMPSRLVNVRFRSYVLKLS